eukprot:scaffold1169_cov120-Cylindrotheca_fusiformis.AAC.9
MSSTENSPLLPTNTSQKPKGNLPEAVKATNKRTSKAKRASKALKKSGIKVGKKQQPVLNNIFVSEEDSERPSGRNVKSWIYTVLNPKSRQLPAVIFKYFIATVICVDFVIYVISTEPGYQGDKRPPLFASMERTTSTIFLIEYVARLYTITENRKYRHWFWGRLRYFVSIAALIDLFATMPYFLERFTGRDLPQLTYLRTFRLARILKTSGFMKAADAVRRVLYYNRQIMTLSLFVGIYMVLLTGVLMYHLRPRDGKSDEFESIATTMYLATLMLTGQGGPDSDLPWYTKAVVLLTSAFSIGMFAIPVSMLTWGFEAEAERCAKRTRQLTKRRRNSCGDDDCSTEEYSTDEDYQKIIAGEESSSDEEAEIVEAMKAAFQSADVDGSGSISFREYAELSRSGQLSSHDLDKRTAALEEKTQQKSDRDKSQKPASNRSHPIQPTTPGAGCKDAVSADIA